MKPVKTVIAVCFAALLMTACGQQSSSPAPEATAPAAAEPAATEPAATEPAATEPAAAEPAASDNSEDASQTSGDKVQPAN
jgi:PBP1b-binding outer membrane lipoprotein LpoB